MGSSTGSKKERHGGNKTGLTPTAQLSEEAGLRKSWAVPRTVQASALRLQSHPALEGSTPGRAKQGVGVNLVQGQTSRARNVSPPSRTHLTPEARHQTARMPQRQRQRQRQCQSRLSTLGRLDFRHQACSNRLYGLCSPYQASFVMVRG